MIVITLHVMIVIKLIFEESRNRHRNNALYAFAVLENIYVIQGNKFPKQDFLELRNSMLEPIEVMGKLGLRISFSSRAQKLRIFARGKC